MSATADNNPNDTLLIPRALRDGIFEYLATRPWKEVAGAMEQLANLRAAVTVPTLTTTVPTVHEE